MNQDSKEGNKAMNHYEELKRNSIRGWNTWNTRSVLSHVYMPHGFAVDLCLKDYVHSRYMKEADVNQKSENEQAKVNPGAHAYDGSYTELKLSYQGIDLQVETAVHEDEQILLVRCTKRPPYTPTLVAEAGILWNRPGKVYRQGDCIVWENDECQKKLYTAGVETFDPYIITKTPYFAIKLDDVNVFSTGRRLTAEEAEAIVAQKREAHVNRKAQFGELSDAYNAMQTCLAWDTVYDPQKDRIISTVSRRWNKGWSGYIMFCWDNYFAAYMAMLDNKAVAYSNAIEMTREKTPAGFVPNYACSLGSASRDRSQPPVGSMVVKELYRKYKDMWLLEMLFDDLYKWNGWWFEKRQIKPGVFAWGSNPYIPVVGHSSELNEINNHLASALESGLDNSPMFDDATYDDQKQLMNQVDVGLTGLVIMDTRSLLDIAKVMNRSEEAKVLEQRLAMCEEAIQQLWSEKDGFFYNYRTDINEFNPRISPTNFYALNSLSLTQEQVDRVINEHFYNPVEFWGDYIIPSISRNDPAYPEQHYWRGRIWAPMNFLTYYGLKTQDCKQAAKDMAEKSVNLILKEWLECGHVHENYCANTGEGCNMWSTDPFYHWGGLLSAIALIENGYLENPVKPLAE